MPSAGPLTSPAVAAGAKRRRVRIDPGRVFGPPPVPAGIVPRTALVNRLRASTSVVIASFAPPGYGKTTLLTEWADRDRRRFGWLTVGRADNLPVSFLTRLALLLGANGVAVEHALRLLRARPSRLGDAVSALANALRLLDEPLVVVFDDTHLLTTPECLDAIEALIEILPAGSQFAFAGRSAPPLSFARFRAHGALAEFGADELRLRHREARALLRGAGLKLPDGEVSRLNEHVEGWAAGLYLTALSLRAKSRHHGVAARGAGPRTDLHEYFQSEVAPHLSRDQRAFLPAIAIPERVSGSLANAITGSADAMERLAELERTNLFLVPLDRTRTWYRFHHLFRELLLGELELCEQPRAVAALNERAALWFEEHDDVESALGHYAAAGRRDRVIGLMEEHTQRLWHDGSFELLGHWLEQLEEPELLVEHPGLAAYSALYAAFSGDAERAEQLSEIVERSAADAAMPDGSRTSTGWKALLRGFECREGPEQMRVDAELALATLATDSLMRPAAFLVLGVARLLLGVDAGAAFSTAAEGAQRAHLAGTQVMALSESALAAAAQGDWERAEELADRAASITETGRVGEQVQALLAWTMRGRIALRRGEWVEARLALNQATELLPRATYALPWYAVQARLELARLHLGVADVTAAAALLDEVDALFARRPALGTLREDADALRDALRAGGGERRREARLTPAELRLVPLLPTHLSFRAIAERLNISRNTVKTEAISIYRKLGVSSRSEAIRRAIELGLGVPPSPHGGDVAAEEPRFPQQKPEEEASDVHR
jgi:LuxR family transcriptional regulator, maltose regulon positive regulatory protein